MVQHFLFMKLFQRNNIQTNYTTKLTRKYKFNLPYQEQGVFLSLNVSALLYWKEIETNHRRTIRYRKKTVKKLFNNYIQAPRDVALPCDINHTTACSLECCISIDGSPHSISI